MKKKILSVILASVMTMSFGSSVLASSNAGKEISYPMDVKNVTVSWYIGEGFIPNQAFARAEDSPFHTGLEEQLGIKINWQYPPAGADQLQNFNLVVASGDYPDIIFYGAIMRDAERYMDEGVIRDLSDYMKDNSPAYYKLLQDNPDYDKAMRTDSGRYYGYGFFREDGGWNDSYMGPLIRQDWLDELGLDVPETISDWDVVLKAFKDKYNAQFTSSWNDRIAVRTGGGLQGAFGAYGGLGYRMYVDDNGKTKLSQAQPEWKDYIAKLNEWWEAGYIDQDITNLDNNMVRTKAINGETGLIYTSMGQLSNLEADAIKNETGANWQGIQYPKGEDGTLSMVFGGPGIGGVVSAITTSVKDDKKLETIMRALDYAYTEEGNLYWNYGKQGVSWDFDANGKPAYTELVTGDPDGLNEAISKYGGSTWSGSCIQETLLIYLKNTESSVAANDIWFYPNKDVTAKNNLPGSVTFTTDESNRKNELEGAIRTYVEEAAVKFMTGAEPMKNFDKYFSDLKKMGLEEMEGLYQDAYDRYLKR